MRVDSVAVIAVVVVVTSASVSRAAIDQWGPKTTGFLIDEGIGRVQIFEAGTYKFDAVGAGGVLEDINEIVVLPNTPSPVIVYVERDPNDGGGPGAANVRSVNLSEATVSEIVNLHVTGEIGENGPIVAQTLSGTIQAGGFLLHPIQLETLAGTISARCNTTAQ